MENLDQILDNLSDDEQYELLELLEEEDEYRKAHQLFEYSPYAKQREFIDAGSEYFERCFMAGNQLGKSYTGGAEVAFHLQGVIRALKGIRKTEHGKASGAANDFLSLTCGGLVAKQTRR